MRVSLRNIKAHLLLRRSGKNDGRFVRESY
jgi:hypothetical protein